MQKSYTESFSKARFILGDENTFNSQTANNYEQYYTFIWATTHKITLKVDHTEIILIPGQILALTPFHNLANIDGKNGIIYQFNREFYCIKDHDQEVGCAGILFFGHKHLPVISITDEINSKFEKLHQEFVEELDAVDTVQGEMLRVLMVRFIITLTRLVKTQSPHEEIPSEKTELFRRYNILVEANYKNEHSVGYYANVLQRSPKTLSNYFSKFESSPLQIIHNRIILEAKRLLIYSEKSSKEIAFELGFEDPSHLSRMFKKHTGIPPSEFKRNSLPRRQ